MASAAWLDEVKRVLQHVGGSDATEVQFARRDLRIRIRRRPGVDARELESESSGGAPAEGDVAVVAPFTGVFYRAPSPTASAYVAEGDLVQPDTVVGLIETMKIFNEVVADRRGRIRKVLVESGQLVHAGHQLMLIEEGEETAGQVHT